MKFAYADPPYIGQARKHYKQDPQCAEVDHNDLLSQLCKDFDAWALSCSSPSLKQILSYPACPKNVRVAAWVKPYTTFFPNVNPNYAWEPVIFYGGRKGKEIPGVRDWLSVATFHKRGLIGAKPDTFCYWIFFLLGAQPGDEFTDLYPGSGIVSRCWEKYILERSNVPTCERAQGGFYGPI